MAARGKGKKRGKNSKKTIPGVLLGILLVTAAALAGYLGAGKIAERITGEAEKNAFSTKVDADGASDEKPSDISHTDKTDDGHRDDGLPTAVNSEPEMKPEVFDLIYAVNPENGSVEQLILEDLDCVNGVLRYLCIDPGISYTVSGSLFRSLANGNATMPQYVTFSKIYTYYGSEKAYDAGRRILEEMLGIKIDYYTAVPLSDFMSVFETADYENGRAASVHVSKRQVFGENGGTEEFSGFAAERLKNAESSRSMAEREIYAGIYGSLDENNILFLTAPVKKNNESMTMDTSTAATLLRMLPGD